MSAEDSRDHLSLLTDPGARELLAAALATANGRLLDWSVQEVDHRPGHSTTVSYQATVRWQDSDRPAMLGASTGLGDPESLPRGVLALSNGDAQVTVWLYPSDPWLPSLAEAYTSELVRSHLDVRVDVPAPRFDVVAYRPGRRAVVRASHGKHALHLKAMRPGDAKALHDRHTLLRDAGVPVAPSLGWTPAGAGLT